LKKIFINKYNKVRSGWKISITLALYYVFGTVSISALFLACTVYFAKTKFKNSPNAMLFNNIYNELLTNRILNFISLAIAALSMITAVLLVLKIIDKRKIKDIGLTSLGRYKSDFIIGLILGAISITVIFVTLLLTGNITLKNDLLHPNFSVSVLLGLVIFILVALNEEMFARGYCMMVLQQTDNKWLPLVVSSIIFTLMHGSNPNICFMGIINIFLVGILFAVMRAKTGSLWMPIGYHIAWNFFLGIVFSFPVSGMALDGIYEIVVTENNLLTGGDFGPEGGILATIVILAGLYYVQMLHKKTN